MAPVRPEPPTARIRARTNSVPSSSRATDQPLPIRRTRTSAQDVDHSLPTLREYNVQEADFIFSLPPGGQSSLVLIGEEMYQDIWAVICDPIAAQHNSRYPPAFLEWVANNFTAGTTNSPSLPLRHNGNRVALRNHVYDIILTSHLDSSHGGSDETAALIYSGWSFVPIELIRRFVAICPTCHRGRMSNSRASSSTSSQVDNDHLNRPPSLSPSSFLDNDPFVPDTQGWDGPTTIVPTNQFHRHEIAQSVFESRFGNDISSPSPYDRTLYTPQPPPDYPQVAPTSSTAYAPTYGRGPQILEPSLPVRSISRTIPRPTFRGLIGGQRTPSWGSSDSIQSRVSSGNSDRPSRMEHSQIDPTLLAIDENRSDESRSNTIRRGPSVSPQIPSPSFPDSSDDVGQSSTRARTGAEMD